MCQWFTWGEFFGELPVFDDIIQSRVRIHDGGLFIYLLGEENIKGKSRTTSFWSNLGLPFHANTDRFRIHSCWKWIRSFVHSSGYSFSWRQFIQLTTIHSFIYVGVDSTSQWNRHELFSLAYFFHIFFIKSEICNVAANLLKTDGLENEHKIRFFFSDSH